MQEKLARLEQLLGRKSDVVQTKFGKFSVEYIDYSAKASALVGDTAEEAVDKLLAFLEIKKYAQDQETQDDETGTQPTGKDAQET